MAERPPYSSTSNHRMANAAAGASATPQSAVDKHQGTYFLGRYRVVDEIGVGGMATVHLARADGPGGFKKWVAIKRIHKHLVEDDQFIRMFLDEARIAAQISHSNVAHVFDIGSDNNTYWIAMEYLHGEPMRELMRCVEEGAPRISTDLACKIIADAAEGLHAAHDLRDKDGQLLGLVHRDVTPHNLFITYEGHTKVVDFGIAKVAGRLSNTRAGTLKGKLAYMSPEQVRGAQIDRRTDIFALGVVLWELTTGHRLFRMESDIETLERVQACVVRPPSTLIPDYPVELESIVMKALSKDRNARFDTARDFARALQHLLVRQGVMVGPEEIAAYLRTLFSDRIQKRDAHLRWAAEVTQTINADQRHDLHPSESAPQPPLVAHTDTPRPAAGMPARSTVPERHLSQPSPSYSFPSTPPAAPIALSRSITRPETPFRKTPAEEHEEQERDQDEQEPRTLARVLETTSFSSPSFSLRPTMGLSLPRVYEDDEEDDNAETAIVSRSVSVSLYDPNARSIPPPHLVAPSLPPAGPMTAGRPRRSAPPPALAVLPDPFGAAVAAPVALRAAALSATPGALRAAALPRVQRAEAFPQHVSDASAAAAPPSTALPLLSSEPSAYAQPARLLTRVLRRILPTASTSREKETANPSPSKASSLLFRLLVTTGLGALGATLLITLKVRVPGLPFYRETNPKDTLIPSSEPIEPIRLSVPSAKPTAIASLSSPFDMPSIPAASASTASPPLVSPNELPSASAVSKGTTPSAGISPLSREPATIAREESGFLNVICNPACDAVFVGSRNLGPSPLVKVPLNPGVYRIVLKRSGVASQSYSIPITSGHISPLTPKME